MQQLQWEGLQYNSQEICQVKTLKDTIEVNGSIKGDHEGWFFYIQYHIIVNQAWHAMELAISINMNNKTDDFLFRGNGEGAWQFNGKNAPELEGCIDVDISFTPFTNTLPIRRLNLNPGETREIKVLYVDVLEKKVSLLKQQYRCMAAGSYRYRNVPNDFEAVIRTDENGYVTDYPGLFKRA